MAAWVNNDMDQIICLKQFLAIWLIKLLNCYADLSASVIPC